MIRPVVLEGSNLLRQDQFPTPDSQSKRWAILQDLRDTMVATGAVGFAANQIAEPYDVCIVRMPGDKVLEMIAPTIIKQGGRYYSSEGCMSIPNYWAVIPRSAEVMVSFTSRNGSPSIQRLQAPYSAYAQHEIDHLHGILIRDYVEGAHGKKGGIRPVSLEVTAEQSLKLMKKGK